MQNVWQESSGKKYDINKIDYDDKEVLESIGTGKTDGVFQLESAGMKNFMKELKPQKSGRYHCRNFSYIVRDRWISFRSTSREKTSGYITYDCPQLEPILNRLMDVSYIRNRLCRSCVIWLDIRLDEAILCEERMSKKKGDVMQKERQNFVYGNEEGVPGCIANGIDEKTANKIYDEMIDFAKYAFNKSHAAAYAVVSYQTAWLKYYYPVEFMAALMTSVIDNPGKVSEYIYSCRQMGIKILPPDINKGEGSFSVDGGNIRYGLAAIKSIGKPVIESIIQERKNGGEFSNLKDFIERLSGKEVNKRTIESFIKSGAFDSLGGKRKQFMVVYVQILDQVNRERKYSMTGQLSLFDIVSDDQKSEFDIPLPDVGEYEKETKLAFEKEVLGVYLSGHPLEDYEEKWKKNISRTTLDFQIDDETGRTKVHDGAKEIVGGMITNKTIKYTKTNKVMAFITLEDLVGSVEVVIFPRDFEKNQMYLNEEAKVFIKGRVSEEDDAPSKLICEQVIPFEQTKKELWLQYPDKATYLQQEGMLQDILKVSEGMDEVIIYCRKEKVVKRLAKGWNVTADEVLLSRLTKYLGESSVKVIEKPIDGGITWQKTKLRQLVYLPVVVMHLE